MPAARRDRLTAAEDTLVSALTDTALTVMARWEADLMAHHGLSRIEFSVLRILSESDDHTCQLSPLASAGHQSLSAMSRTVGRLEARGLVERHRGADDGRSTQAVLTPAGEAKLEEAERDHVATLRRTLLDHLGDIDTAAVLATLDRIRESARPALS